MRVFVIERNTAEDPGVYLGTESFKYTNLLERLPKGFEQQLIEVLLSIEDCKRGDFEIACGFHIKTANEDEPQWTTHYQVRMDLRKGDAILDSASIDFWLLKEGNRVQRIASPHIRWAYELWKKNTPESREEHLRHWFWQQIRSGFERNIARVNNLIVDKIIEVDVLKEERQRLTPFIQDN